MSALERVGERLANIEDRLGPSAIGIDKAAVQVEALNKASLSAALRLERLEALLACSSHSDIDQALAERLEGKFSPTVDEVLDSARAIRTARELEKNTEVSNIDDQLGSRKQARL